MPKKSENIFAQISVYRGAYGTQAQGASAPPSFTWVREAGGGNKAGTARLI
jgi:hypothetical protein